MKEVFGDIPSVAWEELETKRAKPGKVDHEVNERCFRCPLPDCMDTSEECLIVVETGFFVTGKRYVPGKGRGMKKAA